MCDRSLRGGHSSNESLCEETSSSPSTATSIFSCKEEERLLPLLKYVISRSSPHHGAGVCLKGDDMMIEKTWMADGICSWQVDEHHNICAYPMFLVAKSCDDQLLELIGNIPPREAYLTFSLIIIFNMALSHHLHDALDQIKKEGCSLSTRCSLLNRTYLLYQHAKALLCQMQLQHQSSCWFLSYVIFNNEAQVLLMMDEHQEAASLLQAILSYLCWLNLQRRGGIDDLVPVAALETFVHNTSHMILKRVITSPAA